MTSNELIAANEFCISHNIEISFIQSLHESGLVEVTEVSESLFIPIDQLKQLEKLVRLRYDMEINMEGIEAIIHLLQRVELMQQEMTILKSRLHIYE